jgi:hypothetical protein
MFLVRAAVPLSALSATNDVVGNYLQTVGTIYAVLLAFVVFVVWSQFNEARTLVDREANELLDLARTARGFPGPTRDTISRHVRRYVDSVVGPEWEAMSCARVDGFAPASAILEELWDALEHVEPRGPREEALYAQALARINDLSDTRTSRLASACTRIPGSLRALIYTGAAVTVGSMYLFAVESAAVHALTTGALAGAVAHVLYVVIDLDDCFSGDWQVSRAPFERVRVYLAGPAPVTASAAP